jgi:Zn-dependent protease
MFGLLGFLLENPAANFVPFTVLIGALIISIAVHEFAHAWAADHLGDPTARLQGRVTLNPLKHLDPLGSIMILVVGFGWGKPVPFDPYNLRDPIKDGAKIAIAGPISNIILAVLFSLVASALIALNIGPAEIILSVTALLVQLNVMLAVFNMLPVHPLDGGKVLLAFLPKETAIEYDQFMHRFGMFVLLLLILPIFGQSPAQQIISPIIRSLTTLILTLV